MNFVVAYMYIAFVVSAIIALAFYNKEKKK